MKVLILGIAGGIGRQLALRLRASGHEVQGVDSRPWKGAPDDVEVHVIDVRKRQAEDVFRRFRPETIVHMATVTSLFIIGEERYRNNLGGTRAVFDHCRNYGVEHAIFVGRHTFYGAGPDAPLFHTENEPPMELGSFPELADLVAADLYAATALWRFPELCTSVLRICYTLGPSGRGTLAYFLRGRYVPTVLGYDPLFQFMHEHDVAGALAAAIETRPRGVFNVSGPAPVPLSIVIRQAGRERIALPAPLLRRALGHQGLPKLPKAAIRHLQYPIVVDSAPFREQTGFRYDYDETQTLNDFRAAFPPPVRR